MILLPLTPQAAVNTPLARLGSVVRQPSPLGLARAGGSFTEGRLGGAGPDGPSRMGSGVSVAHRAALLRELQAEASSGLSMVSLASAGAGTQAAQALQLLQQPLVSGMGRGALGDVAQAGTGGDLLSRVRSRRAADGWYGARRAY
jgi:hypothetical protein